MHTSELIIGVKWNGHDSSAFVVDVENKKLYGASQERFSRFKHDRAYPIDAIKAANRELEICVESVEQVDICFSSTYTHWDNDKVKPFLYEHDMLWRDFLGAKYRDEYHIALSSFIAKDDSQQEIELDSSETGKKLKAILNEQKKIGIVDVFSEAKRYIQEIYPNAHINISLYDHQMCHAVGAYFLSSFENAMIITSDGAGDGDFSKVVLANGKDFQIISSSKRPRINHNGYHYGTSLGNVYAHFTRLLGFRSESDEGKTEALAAYGEWNNEIYKKLRQCMKIDGSDGSLTMDSDTFIKSFGIELKSDLLNKYKREDIAAAAQKFLEEVFLEYLDFHLSRNRVDNLCLAGGTVANVIVNMKIFEKFKKNLYIIPAMGDDGIAFGAVVSKLLDKGYSFSNMHWIRDMKMPYFGSSYRENEYLEAISKYKNLVEHKLEDSVEKIVATLLSQKKIGAIFRGRAEWGPRALGNRSIVANPLDPELREKLNLKIKKRPIFQPFCPSILEDERERLFEKSYQNRHMSCAFKMKEEFRDILPGAVHIDGTSRAQFVQECDNPTYYKIIKYFKSLTGFGIIVNTSFNKHGRTIVEKPEDAIQDFIDTNLDFLLLGNYLVYKK